MRKKIKVGFWSYNPNNETVVFYSKKYRGYEIDLEKGMIGEWIDHMRDKSWLDIQDLVDLKEIFRKVKSIKPELPIFNFKPSEKQKNDLRMQYLMRLENEWKNWAEKHNLEEKMGYKSMSSQQLNDLLYELERKTIESQNEKYYQWLEENKNKEEK